MCIRDRARAGAVAGGRPRRRRSAGSARPDAACDPADARRRPRTSSAGRASPRARPRCPAPPHGVPPRSHRSPGRDARPSCPPATPTCSRGRHCPRTPAAPSRARSAAAPHRAGWRASAESWGAATHPARHAAAGSRSPWRSSGAGAPSPPGCGSARWRCAARPPARRPCRRGTGRGTRPPAGTPTPRTRGGRGTARTSASGTRTRPAARSRTTRPATSAGRRRTPRRRRRSAHPWPRGPARKQDHLQFWS